MLSYMSSLMFFKECVHTHCKSVVPQVGGLAGVLLSSLRLGGISEWPDVT